jgi:hypothetical protein
MRGAREAYVSLSLSWPCLACMAGFNYRKRQFCITTHYPPRPCYSAEGHMNPRTTEYCVL